MTGARKACTPMAKQIGLISECRQCRENGMVVGIFYNWNSRFSTAGADQNPVANYNHLELFRTKQDVNHINIVTYCILGQQKLFDEAEVEQDLSLLEEETMIKEHTRKKKLAHEDFFKEQKINK